MSFPSLTVAVLTQNNAEHIAALLPLLGFADEIVIVDGGSVDGTPEIATRHGANVVRRPFDNFAAQRNAGMASAKGDWIFFIDSDERPTPALIEEVRRRIGRADFCGYRVPIRSSIFGRRFRFSGTQNDQPLRLVRRDSGRWQGAVHETFAARGAVGRLESYLEHEAVQTVRAFLTKMRRYVALEVEARLQRGEAPAALDRWVRPGREVFRRLIWKQGWLDGPEGWLFCLLSGGAEWLLASEHRRRWRGASATTSRSLPHPLPLWEGGAV
jgi:glycosyltransferase involved in cell wall biosynthesis